jgi:hypothetical protein
MTLHIWHLDRYADVGSAAISVGIVGQSRGDGHTAVARAR